MVISFLQILQESFRRLLPPGDHSIVTLPMVAIFAMASTIVLKGIIWIGCVPIKTTQVQALAQGAFVSTQLFQLDIYHYYRLQNGRVLQYALTHLSCGRIKI